MTKIVITVGEDIRTWDYDTEILMENDWDYIIKNMIGNEQEALDNLKL